MSAESDEARESDGGFRSELTPYATGFYRRQGEDPTEAGVREAKRHLCEGFRAVKLKVGFGVDVDIEYVDAIRVHIILAPYAAVDEPGGADARVRHLFAPLPPGLHRRSSPHVERQGEGSP